MLFKTNLLKRMDMLTAEVAVAWRTRTKVSGKILGTAEEIGKRQPARRNRRRTSAPSSFCSSAMRKLWYSSRGQPRDSTARSRPTSGIIADWGLRRVNLDQKLAYTVR